MFEKILKSSAPRISVIAAPGSGKTKRVLLPKSEQVLADPKVDPKNVLFLTFSRLSAKDLKERVGSMKRPPRVSTVHSLCLAFLLSENSHEMRKRVESIILDFEKEALLWDLKLIFGTKTKRELEKMLSAFSAGWATQSHDSVFEEDDEKRRFKFAVINWLSENEAVMMEEIVYGAVELARKIGATDFISSPQHIFVDEYQDLNRLEQEFIEILAADSQLLLVVGDPDQSIYSFKYSYPNGIKDFATSPNVEAYSSLKTGRCPKEIVEIANQLLLQTAPSRKELLQSVSEQEGKVCFVQKHTQEQEFAYVLQSIAERLKSGTAPQNIIALVPKRALGYDFAKYASVKKEGAGIPDVIKFKFDSKIKLSEIEQKRILLLGLLVKPNSLLHVRGFLGLDDPKTNALEIKLIREKYGDLLNALKLANPEDFLVRQKRIRKICAQIIELRTFLDAHEDISDIRVILDELFPRDEEGTESIRTVLEELIEEGDNLPTIYTKLIDYMRSIPTSPNDVRVMTLMGSKGLEAEHVYILGCNAGNIPGENRSPHLSDSEHKEEQRRLLFVGVTRANKSLTISWARHIPYSQSMQHHTAGLGSVRRPGRTWVLMRMSEFLQDLSGITWEN